MAAVNNILPLEQRLVTKTKKGKNVVVQQDSFDIAKWWQEQYVALPNFAF